MLDLLLYPLSLVWGLLWFVVAGSVLRLWWFVRDVLFASIAGAVWWRVENEYEAGHEAEVRERHEQEMTR